MIKDKRNPIHVCKKQDPNFLYLVGLEVDFGGGIKALKCCEL
jgi:hypothetical protein